MSVNLLVSDSPSYQVQCSDLPRSVLSYGLHQAVSIPAGRNQGAKLLQRDHTYESSLHRFFCISIGYGT